MSDLLLDLQQLSFGGRNPARATDSQDELDVGSIVAVDRLQRRTSPQASRIFSRRGIDRVDRLGLLDRFDLGEIVVVDKRVGDRLGLRIVLDHGRCRVKFRDLVAVQKVLCGTVTI